MTGLEASVTRVVLLIAIVHRGEDLAEPESGCSASPGAVASVKRS